MFPNESFNFLDDNDCNTFYVIWSLYDLVINNYTVRVEKKNRCDPFFLNVFCNLIMLFSNF